MYFEELKPHELDLNCALDFLHCNEHLSLLAKAVLLICGGMHRILYSLPACQVLTLPAAAHPISPQAQLTDQ